MKTKIWRRYIIAKCKDCGEVFDDRKNGIRLASRHAKEYKHVVFGEINLAFVCDGDFYCGQTQQKQSHAKPETKKMNRCSEEQ
jgi:hypothetical protein